MTAAGGLVVPVGCRPLIQTPPPVDVPGAWFDEAAVDRVVRFFAQLRHIKGELGGHLLVLDDWQIEYLIAPVFGWKNAQGYRIVRDAWWEMPRKNAKALAFDTPVPTPDGWTNHGALEVGDEVFTDEGRVTTVAGVTNTMWGRPCYRVTFSDGESLIADAGHLWRTQMRKQGLQTEATGLHTTRELAETVTYGPRNDRNHAVTIAGALELPEAKLVVNPYVLGAWLGDGTTAGGSITSADQEVIDQIIGAGYRVVKRKASYLWGIYGLLAELRDLGVLGAKHIPTEYLRASAPQRLALLQGLMDTDGTVSRRGVKHNITQCIYTSTSMRLAADVAELVRSLGFKATVRETRATLSGKDCGPVWDIAFTTYADRPVFRLTRKLQRLAPPPVARRARSRSRQVVSVEPVPSVPVKCIQIADPHGMYLVGRSFVPTHNSTIGSGVGLYLLSADREPGAEVYALAGAKRQARQVFDPARAMVRSGSKDIRDRLLVHRNVIEYRETNGFFEVLASDAGLQHGLNVHGAIVDEVHVHKTRDLIDAVDTATGSRRQPLIIYITTADEDDRTSIYDEKRSYVERLADGIIVDPSVYGVVFAAADDADPFAEATWEAANPGIDRSVMRNYLASKALKAESSPAFLPTFKRLHLGIRSRPTTAVWLDLEAWDGCPGFLDEDLSGAPAWGGLDLASSADFAAWKIAIPHDDGTVTVLSRFFLPEVALARRGEMQATMRMWAAAGYLTVTPGKTTNFDVIKAQIIVDAAALDLRAVGYDRWNAIKVVQELEDEGIRMVPYPQTIAALSAPAKNYERLVNERKLRHGGNPVLRWMATNVVPVYDSGENVKPDKARSKDKIDGVVADVLAMKAMMDDEGTADFAIFLGQPQAPAPAAGGEAS